MSKKIVGTIAAVVGIVFAVAGIVAWSETRAQLAEQKIVVAEDARWFANEPVKGPLTAYAQQDIIKHHAAEATGGKTYAQMDREDPLRAVQASASSLRASLFTSILAFGVSLLAFVLGLVLILLGGALRQSAALKPSAAEITLSL